MIGWNREFQYLPVKIIGKIVKYQYLPAKTIHFSLSHLTLSSLSHIPLSPLFSWLWLHSQLLSVTLGHPSFEFILMHLFRGLSSKLITPPSVRASVRPPPRGSSKHMISHHTVWNSRKSHMYFTVLSSRRLQNTVNTTLQSQGTEICSTMPDMALVAAALCCCCFQPC